MLNYTLKPSYDYQELPWKNYVWKNLSSENLVVRPKRSFKDIARAVKFSTKLMSKALSKRVKCTILYATETGKSERYAKSLVEIFKNAFDPKLFRMDEYDVANLEHETLLLIISSTFGNGYVYCCLFLFCLFVFFQRVVVFKRSAGKWRGIQKFFSTKQKGPRFNAKQKR